MNDWILMSVSLISVIIFFNKIESANWKNHIIGFIDHIRGIVILADKVVKIKILS